MWLCHIDITCTVTAAAAAAALGVCGLLCLYLLIHVIDNTIYNCVTVAHSMQFVPDVHMLKTSLRAVANVGLTQGAKC